MRAELIIDLPALSHELARITGRRAPVMPDLSAVSSMWEQLDITLSAVWVVAPQHSLREFGTPVSGIEHVNAWWMVDEALRSDLDLEVSLVPSAFGDDAIGSAELTVATALRRSDESLDDLVIIMSNDPSAAAAITHARGAVVALAGTAVDNSLAHIALRDEWLSSCVERFESPEIDARIEGTFIVSGDETISSALDRPLGRDGTTAVLPSMSGSAAIFDPSWFEASGTVPTDEGIARIVHTLGLGELVHIVTPADQIDPLVVSTELVATLYRIATDHPEIPIVVASNRPSLVLATSDPKTWGLNSPRRMLRLCLPQRSATFEEHRFVGTSAVSRIVLEHRLSTPLFEPAQPIVTRDRDAFDVIDGDGPSSVSGAAAPTSPTLVLYTNPNRIKVESAQWRSAHDRRFLVVGADGSAAAPADDPDGRWLPVEIGQCDDFLARQPRLSAGDVVEGVLRDDAEAWVVVSDPIERRRTRRKAVAA